MLGDDLEWHWAHVMWQCYGISLEDWAKKDREVQLAYIASHLAEQDKPINRHHAFVDSFFNKEG